ncbi:hypothetical protein GCM10009548_22320 [Streptomyces malaysiensis subsp. malaysiensis]
MPDHMPRFVRRLWRLLAPGAGRHRADETCASVPCANAPTLRLPRMHQWSDRRQERRGKDVSRVELLCAPHGMVVVK